MTKRDRSVQQEVCRAALKDGYAGNPGAMDGGWSGSDASGVAPLIGRKAIVAWVEAIVSKMPGHMVVKEEVEFHDIELAGDWASEWATEHQAVQPADGKPPIEGYGKMAFLLHREASGKWKIKQEMWNGRATALNA